MILIISYMNDWHSKAVRWSLAQCGVECEEVDSYYLPSTLRMTLEIDAVPTPRFRYCLGSPTQSLLDLRLADIRVAWMRRLNDSDFDYSDVHTLDRGIVKRECGAFLRNLYASIQKSGCVCINDENLSKRIDNKAVQLLFARDAGLTIPSTIISNDSTEVEEFAARHGGSVIVKPFFQELWEDEDGRAIQLASMASLEQIRGNGKAISLCPYIYQEAVPKNYELRIVVMGDQIYAIRIDSQANEGTRVDWRADSASCSLSQVHIPPEVGERILQFMRLCGIQFGSLDFVVTPKGEYVFLEINEQGQFLWVERRNPDIRILQAMTAYLGRCAGLELDVSEISLDGYFRSTQYTADSVAYTAAKQAHSQANA